MELTSNSGQKPQRSVWGLLLGVLACAQPVQAVAPRQLLETADLANVVMSPDGDSVVFRLQRAHVERNALETSWYVQDVEGAAPPRRIGDGGFAMQEVWGVSAPAPAVWSPDGRWIYYGAMINGAIDVWRAAADGSRAEPVTLDPADVRAFSLSADGRTLSYAVGATREQERAAEQAEYDHGIRIDDTVPIGPPLLRSGYILGRPATQRYRDGIELHRASLLSDVPSRWKVVDLVTGQRRELAPSEAPSLPWVIPAQPDGQAEASEGMRDPRTGRIATLTGAGDGRGMYGQPYATLAVQLGLGREPIRCGNEQCTDKAITSALWRPHHQEVLFTVTDRDEGSAQSIFRWNFETDTVHPVAASRGLINGGRDERSPCGVSAQVMVCVAAEADRPPRLERIDLDSGQRRVLFEPNAGLALEIAASVPARFLRWTNESGQTVTGQFFAARRSDGALPPLFVNYYNCSGFVRGGLGDEWPLVTLAESGISALCINHIPLKLDAVERYESGLAVVRSAVELLSSAGEIDRTRVGMGGLSLGTEVTLWTVVNSDLLSAASVSSVALTPLGYALRHLHDGSFDSAVRKYRQLGSPDETPERWRKQSMAHNLATVDAPILMQLAEHEYVRSMDYAIPLIKNRQAELHVFPEEGHLKFQPRHKLAVYERNLDWFKFWLLDHEDPAFSKQEQYTRWREMKARRDGRAGLANQPGG
ncbi:Atxe2 family lasso peptide isopeptidase [Luteimonas sp. RIT-PG2_3]